MALNIKLLYGKKESLPAQKDGQLLFTTDEGAIYLDINGARINLYELLIGEAKTAGTDAQKDVDALTAKVGEVADNKTVIEMINDVKALITGDGEDEGDQSLAQKVAANAANIKVNTDAIAVLNGDATTAGSVAKQVADAVAAIVNDAPEAFDTLKEISDWLSSHETSAAAMNTQITANKTDIAALKTALGVTEGEDGEETPIVNVEDAIKTAIDALDVEDTAATDEYVAAVSQTDGKITVTRKPLPSLDGLSWGTFEQAASETT